RLNAYVHSEALPIPAKPLRVDLTVEPGVRAARGGRPTGAQLKQTVTVPGLFSLQVQSADLSHADNDQLVPERLVVVNLSSDTHEREVAPRVKAWALPVYHPDSKPEDRKQPYVWTDPAQIGPEILQRSEALKLTPVAAEREYVSRHVFKMSVDA